MSDPARNPIRRAYLGAAQVGHPSRLSYWRNCYATAADSRDACATGARRGITLVELLVVIGIMLILAMVTIPMLRPLAESRRIREAARSLNVFFGQARNRAVQTQRPCGVIFERLSLQPQACAVLRHAEVPPPYAGENVDAVVQPMGVTPWVDPQGVTHYYLGVRIRAVDFSAGLIRRGDLMQLNHQGRWYVISDNPADNNPAGQPNPPAAPGADFPLRDEFNDGDPSNDIFIDFTAGGTVTLDPNGVWIISHLLSLELDPVGGLDVPWGAASSPVPFEILRQPVPSAGPPMQLPRGAVVDLAASGSDTNPTGFAPSGAADASPVIVLFGPNGAVDRVVVQGAQSRVTEPIYFLVGKWERIPTQPGGPPIAEDGLYNFQDATNLWVALNSQTGLVTVAEPSTYFVDPADGQLKDNYDPARNLSFPPTIPDSRRLVREAQISKGGR